MTFKGLLKLNANTSLHQTVKNSAISHQNIFYSNMVFHQVIATFLALFDAIGIPGNLPVIVVITLETRFHVMRCILLASLAVSDLLFLILVNSFRIASIAKERWVYGETMCHLSAFFARYFYLNTVLHLLAVSYERYKAIVKSPMTYNGDITKSRVMLIVLVWVIPIPFSVCPFIGLGKYVYNPEVFFCQQGWAMESGSHGWREGLITTAFIAIPFLIILFLNCSVYKTANVHANIDVIQIGSISTSEMQQERKSRRRIESKAAIDVFIIITAFLLCYLPGFIEGLFRRFVQSIEVSAHAVLIKSSIFIVSSVCNPIIYSIRKREFRTVVKNMFRRIKLCRRSNDINNEVTAMGDLRMRGSLGVKSQDKRFQESIVRARLNVVQVSRRPPIPEIDEELG